MKRISKLLSIVALFSFVLATENTEDTVVEKTTFADDNNTEDISNVRIKQFCIFLLQSNFDKLFPFYECLPIEHVIGRYHYLQFKLHAMTKYFRLNNSYIGRESSSKTPSISI